HNTIPLTAGADEMRALVMTMFTDPNRIRRKDPGNPDICNLFQFHKLFSDVATVARVDRECRTAMIGCVDYKQLLAEVMLDLLLHLIRQHKVDIYDIPITLITEQYTAYLDAMEELNLEVAADYIYMAALLIHIKSKMLLPRDDEAQPAEDPRQELVDRLLEYQRFKAVAESFAEIDVLRMGVWPRPHTPIPGQEASEIDMSEVSLFELIDAFRTALNSYQ